MVGKMWPALKPCTLQSCKASDGEGNDCRSQLPVGTTLSSEMQNDKASGCELDDRLSQMPDDILLSFLSSFTVKEVARTSVLSRRWKYLWRYFPVLKFEDRRALDEIRSSFFKFADRNAMDKIYDIKEVVRERSNFARWVNHIVDQHLASTVNELRVTFDLDSSFHNHVDKWVVFALTKQVKTLVLDFTPEARCLKRDHYYTLPLDLPRHLADGNHPLTSLCFKSVNVTTEQIDCLLFSCPFVEDLCIEASEFITSLRASGPSLQSKHLGVSYCLNLKAIDISAPKLMLLTYYGRPLELHISSALSLSKVSIGGLHGDPIGFALDALSDYFPQLEDFTLQMYIYEKLNLRINNVPSLTNLKHLGFRVDSVSNHSLLGWAPLIEASPVLEKLSLKMNCDGFALKTEIIEHEGRPLKCLKTLELGGFTGENIDIQLANYVFKNAIMLEEVVVDFEPLYPNLPGHDDLGKRKPVTELEKGLPRGVKLTVK